MKSIWFTFTFVLIALITRPVGVLAQGPPINTDTPILLGLEGKAAMVRVMVVKKSQLYQDGEKISDSLQREVDGMMFPIAIPYNITSDFLVGGMIPLMNVRAKSLSGSSSSFGLGDLSLFAKYLVVQIDGLQETFRIIGKGSIKLPTGNKNLTPPLGTGTVDYSLGAVSAWIGKRFGVYGDVSYSLNGTSGGYKFGNSLNYNVALGFRALPAVYETYPTEQWNLYLELNGKHTGKDEVNEQELSNTGGNIIFLSPGVQYIPSREFILEASVQIPISQKLNGTQLGTSVIGLIGVRALFF
ncbi:MAG: hypothetical protein HY707_03480 [Ignavibacteriae bacterium]|nr:hypothetical protein [Ignavibacteriota bacterium]